MYKNPNSVLVAVYCEFTHRVLMLQRKDDPSFWQSITGSLELGELPRQAATREVKEEIGVDIVAEGLSLFDCNEWIKFEIFPHFRYKYAPDITHSIEHWFLLALPDERAPVLTEHIAFQWLSISEAVKLTKSWNNSALIEKYLSKLSTNNI
ncbi:dihydroneopterin triphosphate diphosphatase [Pasteurella canis]|uniref:Dihydroneopterin triphosphate pyrophosphatase n=1 Tax=Pasteurella canis TaxID=753 RepID=A0A379ESJ6_9PAST|nr:dihydroneopterin triphosphate diphosphatase [Pasteurella canis]MXN89556.1 dihydroneopterin triphosphate diphosphatase [Pasteurella canis]UAX42399.1 dihydroneopterin triphosphate diphosphatase [Pasteurella canis]UAY77955.1 dihydroneopterin triphosphate diphosphatase [Pasteurella canis]UDW83971.1 dihydroneopterin triphosphate diphosphatase [Pasteurella canis]UEC23486.1 dihydroneopterin triphosphate diphosphatase [Pasteurella canis]